MRAPCEIINRDYPDRRLIAIDDCQSAYAFVCHQVRRFLAVLILEA